MSLSFKKHERHGCNGKKSMADLSNARRQLGAVSQLHDYICSMAPTFRRNCFASHGVNTRKCTIDGAEDFCVLVFCSSFPNCYLFQMHSLLWFKSYPNGYAYVHYDELLY